MFEGMSVQQVAEQMSLPLHSPTELLIERLTHEAHAANRKAVHEARVFINRSAGQRMRFVREFCERLQAEHAMGVRTGRYYNPRPFSRLRDLMQVQAEVNRRASAHLDSIHLLRVSV